MVKPLEPGQRLGAFEIVRQLDAGGMGMVYEAVHVELKTRCAIKVFVADSERRDYLRKHFRTEGRLLSAFRHPNIVHVTDMDVDSASGAPYFAMDLILSPDGTPRTLEEARKAGVDEEQVVGWLQDMCNGLGYIHGKGVVHRDISLENVMVGPGGHAIITDFGVARINDRELRQRIEHTRFTMVELGTSRLKIGKDHYIAPELLRDKMPAKASERTDAYALGVLLFRLLTGFWFERDRRDNARDMLAGMAYDWFGLIDRLLDDHPAHRLPDGGIAEVPRLLKLAQPCRRGRRQALAIAGAAALAVAAGAALVWGLARPFREPALPIARPSLTAADIDDFESALSLKPIRTLEDPDK